MSVFEDEYRKAMNKAAILDVIALIGSGYLLAIGFLPAIPVFVIAVLMLIYLILDRILNR